jgi:hypothetical protein
MAVAAVLGVLTVGPAAFAQDSGAQGSCLLPPAKLSDDIVKSFKDHPSELLTLYPDGGPAMSQYVRRLAGSDVSMVPLLIALAKDAGPAHVVAIGIGLARAAAVCARTKPGLGNAIKEQVSKSGMKSLESAFTVGLSSYEVTGLSAVGAPDTGSPIGNLAPPGGGVVSAAPAVPSDPAPSLRVENRVLFTGGGGVTKTFDETISPTR